MVEEVVLTGSWIDVYLNKLDLKHKKKRTSFYFHHVYDHSTKDEVSTPAEAKKK